MTSTSSDTFISSSDKMELLRKNYNYKPENNSLSNYDNPTYHIRFSMISDTSTISRVVIAESGASIMNIQSFTMRQTVGPNQNTKNIGTNIMSMTIYDPFSADIYDKLRLAADSLYIPDATKSIFLIELSFMGYDSTTGNQVTNIYGTTAIKCIMLDITTSITPSGSVNNIQLAELVDQGSYDEYMVIDRSLITQSQDGTLGTTLSNLAIKLNEANAKNFFGVQMTTYQFKYENYPSGYVKDGVTSPSGLQVRVNISDRTQSQRNASDMTAAKSTTIQDIIEQLIANSPTASKLMGDTDPKTGSTNDNFISGVGHKILISVQYTGWSSIYNSYKKIITYKIVPYKFYHINNSPQNVQNFVTNETLSMEKFKKLCNEGVIKKEYNYQYTGKNTEVLNFDIKTQMNFSYVFLPAITDSKINNAQATNNNPKYVSDKLKLDDLQKQYNNAEARLSDLNDQITTETDPVKKNNLQTQISQTTTAKSAITSQITTLTQSVDSYETQVYNKRQTLINAQTKNRYVDDIENNSQNAASTSYLVPSSIRTNNIDNISYSGNVEQHRDYGQAIYSALLSQYYGSDTAAFQSINLGIKFDPYWLSNQTIEQINKNTTVIPITSEDYGTQENYSNQFVHFILNFNIPTGVNETTGSLSMNTSDTYSGVYQVIDVESNFEGGKMSQVLNAVKLNVLTLGRILGKSTPIPIGGNTSNTIPSSNTTSNTNSEWPSSSNIANSSKLFASNLSNSIDSSIKTPSDIVKSLNTTSKTTNPINLYIADMG